MYSKSTNFKLYQKDNIRNYFSNIAQNIVPSISKNDDDYILNVNVEEYINYLLDRYEIDFPSFDFENVYVDYHEEDVPIEFFDRMRWTMEERSSYRMQIIEYYVPFNGDVHILEYCPASIIAYGGLTTGKLSRENNTLKFEFINFNFKPEAISKIIDNFKNDLMRNFQTLQNDSNNLFQQLRNELTHMVNERRQKILSQRKVMSSLGIPLKKKSNTPETFSIPKPILRKKIQIQKPEVLEKGFKPEPALDKSTFNQILSYINDVGRNFENKPSLYSKKGEEDLRDHILLILDPNFELGTATGETFNKSGKTDIMLKYESTVVFIAECKFWKGESQYLKTIDQLLRYLTWRNSKSAVIIFSKNKDFSGVLNSIEKATPSHPNFLKKESKQSETWFNYKFHINGDRNRLIDLAILAFHIP